MHSGFSGRHMTAAIVVAWASAAHAEESKPIATPHAEVWLASEVDAFEPGKPFRLGLHFKLAKGWHIYWSNPGSAGQPPEVDFVLPEGAKASEIVWPAPLRVPEGPAMTYSYLDEALLPLTLTTRPRLLVAPDQGQGELADLREDLRAGGRRTAPRPGSRRARAVRRGAAVRGRRRAHSDPRRLTPPRYPPTVFCRSRAAMARSHRRATPRSCLRSGARSTISRRRRSTFTAGKLSLALKSGPAFDPRQGARRRPGAEGRCGARTLSDDRRYIRRSGARRRGKSQAEPQLGGRRRRAGGER